MKKFGKGATGQAMRITAPVVEFTSPRKLRAYGKSVTWVTCERCGKDHPRKRGGVYKRAKDAERYGTDAVVLCNSCLGDSRSEVKQASIELAGEEQLTKAIRLLKRAGKLKAAQLLEAKLTEKMGK